MRRRTVTDRKRNEDVSPDALTALLAQAREENRRLRRRNRILTGISLLFILFLASSALFPIPDASFKAVMTTFFIYNLTLGIWGGSKILNGRHKQVFQPLLEENHPAAVGPLLDTWAALPAAHNIALRYAIVDALERLLPRMTAHHAPLLDAGHVRTLCRILKGTAFKPVLHRDINDLRWRALEVQNEKLALAVLSALAKFGDRRTLALVDRILQNEAETDSARDVQEAAVACRDALLARLDRERAGASLLRPASAPEEPAGTLLRPAQGAREADAETLLRPVSSSSPDTGPEARG